MFYDSKGNPITIVSYETSGFDWSYQSLFFAPREIKQEEIDNAIAEYQMLVYQHDLDTKTYYENIKKAEEKSGLQKARHWLIVNKKNSDAIWAKAKTKYEQILREEKIQAPAKLDQAEHFYIEKLKLQQLDPDFII